MSSLAPFTAREKAKIDAEGYFAALGALESAESGSSLSRTEIARRSGIARATVTRVLNGSARNITLRTLFLLVRAMGHKLSMQAIALNKLYLLAGNFHFDPPEYHHFNSQTVVKIGRASATTASTAFRY